MLFFPHASQQAERIRRVWWVAMVVAPMVVLSPMVLQAAPPEPTPTPDVEGEPEVEDEPEEPPRDAQAARLAYERARVHFEAEEFLAAAEALREAYALDPKVDYLYQHGHALRLAGGCAGAIEVFQQVEAQVEASAQRAEVQRWIEHCREVVRAAGGTDLAGPSADPTPVDDAPAPADPVPSETVASEDDGPVQAVPRKDVLAGVLLGVGSTVALAGAGLVVGASVVAGRDFDRESEPHYERRAAQVRTLQVTGGVALGVGLVVVAGAVARYGILVARRRRGFGGSMAKLSVDVDAVGLRLRF